MNANTVFLLRRGFGNLVLLGLLGLGIAFFLLRYVPQQTATLNARYFRVLAGSAGQLRQADPAAVPPIDTLRARLSRPEVQRRDAFRHLFLVRLPADTLPTGRAAAGQPTWARLPPQVLTDTADTNNFYLPAPTSALLAWLGQEGPLYGGRTSTLTLAGEPYRLFALPVRLGGPATWLLCGTVPGPEFDRDARALPAGWSVFIMGLVLLGLLALPFLKLALMSSREQLGRADLVRCGVSLVLGTSVLLLTCQATLVRHYFEQERIDAQLRELARRVAKPAASARRRAGRVAAPLLPPGFSYGVVDSTGTLRYHAAPALHTGENLRVACTPSQSVGAVLNGLVDSLTTSVSYQGRPARLHLRRLDARGHYLVAYFDLRYSGTHQFQVWVMAMELLGFFWLFGLGFGLLYQLLVRRSDRWPLSRDSLRHFWPGRGYAFRYYQVLLGLLTGLAVLSAAYYFVQPVGQFYLLLTVPVQVFLLSFRYTRLRNLQELEPLRRLVSLAAGWLLLLTVLYASLFYWAAGDNSAKWLWGKWVWGVGTLLVLDAAQCVVALVRLHRAAQAVPGAPRPPTWHTWAWAAGAGAVLLAAAGLLALVVPDAEAAWLLALRGGLSVVLWLLWRQAWTRPRYNSRLYFLLHQSRLAYRFMVLAWIMLLGMMPVILFYRTSRTTERLGEVRYAQLVLLHGQRQQSAPDTTGLYAFYQTHLLPRAPAPARRQPVPAQRVNLAVLARLHPDADTLLASSLLLQPAADRSAFATWTVSSLLGADRAVSSSTGPRWAQSTVAFRSGWTHIIWELIVMLLLSVGLWLALRYAMLRIFPLVPGPPTRLTPAQKENPALAASLLPHRYWLLPGRSGWEDAPAWAVRQLGVEPQPPARFDCRLLFPYAPSPVAAPAPESPASTSSLVDRQAAEWQQLHRVLAAATDCARHAPLVLTHFEHGRHEVSLTLAKCQLLELLLPLERPLLVLCSVHPVAFGDCGHPEEAACALPDHHALRQAGQRLLDLLSSFRLQYFSLNWLATERPLPELREAARPVSPVDFASVAAQAELAADLLLGVPQASRPIRSFFERECRAFPFLPDLRLDAIGALWRQRNPTTSVRYAKYEDEIAENRAARHVRYNQLRDVASPPTLVLSPDLTALQPNPRAEKAITQAVLDHQAAERQASDHFGRLEAPTREAIADTLRRLAWLYFHRLWHGLSAQERFLLYDLAYDGLVNPQNRHHLHNLLHKGLLRLDDHGRLRLASEAFRAFVFAERRRPDVLRYAPDDTWGAVRAPLVAVLSAGALFVAFTQPVPLSQLQWALAMLAALLPQVSFLLKLPAAPASKADPQ